MTERHLVDATGWLEYFADGPNAGYFAAAIEQPAHLLVPTVVITKVFRRIYLDAGEGEALQAAALLQQGIVVDFDDTLALDAGRIAATDKLALPSAMLVATARRHGALIWTQDDDFADLPDVRYTPKRKRPRAGS
jgi:predicted nucleic acid-binding protein